MRADEKELKVTKTGEKDYSQKTIGMYKIGPTFAFQPRSENSGPNL